MDVKEIGRQAVDWIQLAQNRYEWQVLVNTILDLAVP
jgi:hypothetical protein